MRRAGKDRIRATYGEAKPLVSSYPKALKFKLFGRGRGPEDSGKERGVSVRHDLIDVRVAAQG